jgi:hypothetical protein
MTKKIVWGVVLFGLIGLLVAGALVRTVAKTGDGTGTRGGYGRNSGNHRIVDSSPDAGAAELSGQEGTGTLARGAGFGDGTGTGQAQVDEWLTLEGTVVSVDAEALVVLTASGEQVALENRPWSFALEQGFVAQPGDQVTLVGFYENGTLEVGQLADASNGQTVQLRDESGRPMWAGRGRRNGH